jgi:hypothetical protein
MFPFIMALVIALFHNRSCSLSDEAKWFTGTFSKEVFASPVLFENPACNCVSLMGAVQAIHLIQFTHDNFQHRRTPTDFLLGPASIFEGQWNVLGLPGISRCLLCQIEMSCLCLLLCLAAPPHLSLLNTYTQYYTARHQQ